MWKILIWKKGIVEKISYERRAYESVDDIGATLRSYLEKTEAKTRALMG